VTTLIVVNVAIFVMASLSQSLQHWIYGLGAMQAQAVLDGQVWRLITAQYLHASIAHLFINMLVLHFLGRALEDMWSARRFFWVYTMCGLSGNVFYTILGAGGIIDPQLPAVGASGSIYGLLGIVAVLFPTATVYIYFLFPIRIRTAAFIFGAISVFTIWQRGYNYGGEACHLAGLVFGVWWAMKGDAWWSRTEFWLVRRLRRTSGSRPARVHASRTSAPRRRSWFSDVSRPAKVDLVEVDRILKKVYDGGLHSLTDSEKAYLREATERQREEGLNAGRFDPL
jgi:membrane associated rhomboid family serine protease